MPAAEGPARVLHQGRVVLPDGGGASAALVFVKTGTGPTPEIAIRCDSEGRFRLALPTGRYVLAARAVDGRVGEIDVESGQEPQDLQVSISD